jgi:hypothetical protein
MTTLEQLAKTINSLSSQDWEVIFAATRPRLLYVHHEDVDDESNRVLCRMDASNLLFDIRDYVQEKGNYECTECYDKGCKHCLGT